MKAHWIVFVLVIMSAVSFSNGLYIQAKAEVAQWLLQDAWYKTLTSRNDYAGDVSVKPWPWADIWPIAAMNYLPESQAASNLQNSSHLFNRSSVGKQIESWVVLNESSGQGLAFGPTKLKGSASPGEPGWLMIAGHRDTHFRFLERAKVGDMMEVQDDLGRWHVYEIDVLHVVDSRHEALPSAAEIDEPGLMLITCYPFNLIDVGGPLRFVALGRYISGQMPVDGAVVTINSDLPHAL
mgnify:CR=1 FL=1